MSQGPLPTGYEPLNTLKPVGPSIWVIDGAHVVYKRLPLSGRATVIRLGNGDLWVHSPTALTDDLRAELIEAGPVRHIIAPNPLHVTFTAAWQAAFPDAVVWAAPGAADSAARIGAPLIAPRALDGSGPFPWAAEIDQLIVEGNPRHREVVFHHRATSTLIVTDLVAAIETRHMPVWARPLVWIMGVDDSDGRMPPALRRGFRRKELLADAVEAMIAWQPTRMILAHGRCYDRRAGAELERAFRRLLRDRQWGKVMEKMDAAREREGR